MSGKNRDHIPFYEVVVLLGLVAAAIAGIHYAVFRFWIPYSPANLAIGLGITALYFVAGLFVYPPKLDPDDVQAWDNPFTLRDDAARAQLGFILFMIPAIIFSTTLSVCLQEIAKRMR